MEVLLDDVPKRKRAKETMFGNSFTILVSLCSSRPEYIQSQRDQTSKHPSIQTDGYLSLVLNRLAIFTPYRIFL